MRMLILSFLFPVFAQAAITLENYPFLDTESATISTAFLKSYSESSESFTLEILPERAQVPLLEGRHLQTVGFYHVPSSRKLAIIIAGLGGDPQSGLISYLGTKIKNQGSNVLTLPNPLSWRFALGASQTGYPGYSPNDAKDLLRIVKIALAEIQKIYPLSIDSVSVVGYSLGALNAAYLAPLIEENLHLRLHKVLLLNSPVDLAPATKVIDDLYDKGESFSTIERNILMGTFINYYRNNDSQFIIPEYPFFRWLAEKINMDKNLLSWAIGKFYRDDLASIVYVSQQVNDRGVLRVQHTTSNFSNLRLDEAQEITFKKYMNDIVMPLLRESHTDLSVEEMVYRGGLRPLTNLFRSDKRYVFFHTMNDFLTTPATLEWSRLTFGPRAIYFDRGGHLGEVWSTEFQNEFLRNLQ